MSRQIKAVELFRRAVSAGCSDIHVKPGSPPKMRKNGKLIVVPGYEADVLSAEQTRILAFETMSSYDVATFSHKIHDHDYAFEVEEVGRFRMNVYKTRGETAFVARLLQNKPKTLDELGISKTIMNLAKLNAGIVFVTGATGSGKSTTMAGLIDIVNKSRPVNIISIEDPIEIMHTDAMASISQREIGSDAKDFSSALKAALREDPDVILIGEVRDLETLKTALLAADTGHLVITTLHTTDTAETINRILSMYPPEERETTRRVLASALRAVVGQRLVPSLQGGRTVVNEILINTQTITELIHNSHATSKEFKEAVETGEAGMQSFEQHFIKLIEAGKIDLKTAKAHTVPSDSNYYDNAHIKFPEGYNQKEVNVPKVNIQSRIPQSTMSSPSKPKTAKEEMLPPVRNIKQPPPKPVLSPSSAPEAETNPIKKVVRKNPFD